MSYNAWSVVAFEQPTAAKWNQLGDNDAGLRDGSNVLWNNNQAIQGKDSGGTARNILKLTSGNILEVADGANMYLGLKNKTKARAYLPSNQSNADNSTSKIQLSSETYDIGSNFDTVNYRFIAPIPGYYLIIGSLGITNVNTGRTYNLKIMKNTSTELARTQAQGESNTETVVIKGMDLAYLNTNDYVELHGYHNAGSTQNFSGGENLTYMAVHLIST